MSLIRSWVESANAPGTQFPLNNLPCGVFSEAGEGRKRRGIAIGEMIFDVTKAAAEGLVPALDLARGGAAEWNGFMALGPGTWQAFREALTGILCEDAAARPDLLVPQAGARLHMPFDVTEYTDFYASRHHATNVGTMFRGAENALPPNWLHIPIGYNGRASSVVVSGTEVRRPWGQLKFPGDDTPVFAPSARFDIELELGAIVGQASGGPVSVDRADEMIFGYVLLNDWSARDIQAWEYQPLGPFQSKATATSISPWIVTKAALEPFRRMPPARELPLLPHLRDTGPMLYDIDLSVDLNGERICRTNYAEMYYSAAQQLAHHTSCGCPMRVGDLLGSGTISGPQRDARGSLLEITWGGKELLTLSDGSTRAFLEDRDRISLQGSARGDGYLIGFGECSGTLVPATEP